MAKKKEDKELNLDQILFKCRDHLRAARNSGSFFEKRDMMLTLVFLRFIGEKYEDGVEALDTALVKIAEQIKILEGCFVKGTFTTRNLAPND